jgi:peptidoglycan/xylan/chitin deacetylase (PgdA/CDA1 family)
MADRFHVHVKTIQRDHDLLRAVTGDRGVCRRAEEGSYRRRHSKPRWRYSKPRRRVFCRWLEAKATPRLEGRPESKSSLRPWTGDTFSGGRIVLTCYCGIKRAADQAVRMRGMWGWRVNGRKWPKRVKGGWEVVASQPE